mmetsp:Transcript_30287/g.100458  ORF Transcript_30287/g.100458 Transcript_30287/m.100458 type:complete len:326 (+) Transcript_30287:83-1060(+)
MSIRVWQVWLFRMLTGFGVMYYISRNSLSLHVLLKLQVQPATSDEVTASTSTMTTTTVTLAMMSTTGSTTNASVVCFWHLGKTARENSAHHNAMIRRQVAELRDLEVTRLHPPARIYVVDGFGQLEDATRNNITSLPNAELLKSPLPMKEGVEYYEYPTLVALHQFCLDRTTSADTLVVYFHSKTVDAWRKAMEKKVLGTPCFDCMKDHTKIACGFDWTKHLTSCGHFAGNFWMARCSHVKQLRSPFFEELLAEARVAEKKIHGSGGWPHDVRAYGRFYAETWVLNAWADQELVEHKVKIGVSPNFNNLKKSVPSCRFLQTNVCP